MQVLSEKFSETVKIIAESLKDKQYCIRGTASLVLQGLDMNVDDIDVLCDSDTALFANSALKEYLVDPVSFKESPKFKSYFGKFNIDGVEVEFMGDWQIKNTALRKSPSKKGEWSKVFDGSSYNVVKLDDKEVKVTKIADELEMFLLMGRFTAYQKIKRQLKPQQNISQSTPQKALFD